MVKVKFWGVRGSVPAPLTGAELSQKLEIILRYFKNDMAFTGRKTEIEDFLKTGLPNKVLTYGGNTPCVEIMHGDGRIILDMGTGLRPLGNALFKEMMEKKGLNITFLLSHVHWDHIQGLPFFGPLYINKETGIKNSWNFYGGTDWMKTAEICLHGQMDPPTFPISWEEIEKITHHMSFHDLYDRKKFNLGNVEVYTRKLNHPQETFGWRLTFQNPDTKSRHIVAYTTDNEPNDPQCPDPKLIDLIHNADLWITDCQYTKSIYEGAIGGVPRHNWGHSYPEAVVQAAIQANVGHVILFHHDPSSSDEAIYNMERETQELFRNQNQCIAVTAAHEGLEIAL